jgi:RND family efflux transporter MFP subunit
MIRIKTFRPTSLPLLLTASLVLAGGLGCTSEKPYVPPPPETVSNVSVLVVQRTLVRDYLEAVGTVRAAQTSQLASQTMGGITNIPVHEGDRVRRGQVLAVIDDAQARAGMDRASAAVAAAQQEFAATGADYALAGSTLKRYQSLYEKKSVSPQEYDEVKTRFAAAEARRDAAQAGKAQAEAGLAQARTSYGYTRIRAPFDGVITAKLADAGTMATPGTPLLVVEDQAHFRLEATVDETDIASVRLGQTVPVVLDATQSEVQGKAVQIVPAADPSTRTFTVKIELPKTANLRSGLFGRARFARGQRESITIPQTAVLERGQLHGVYIVGPDQLASLRYVTLGRQSGTDREVLSGLEEGDRVVARPGDRELAGRKIEVK